MEAKYIYNFRKFDAYTRQHLTVIAKGFGITYAHPYLNKRELAKKLAIYFFEKGTDFKSEFMEVD